ncbi:MAG: phage holin family protein [Clostridiales bacterium]|jgi:toxin secretion/phage lysis holin|nr:phage holin family protein [Clostridiales bacterium]
MFENVYVRGISAAVISLFTYLFGGLDTLLTALIAMICIDFITGAIKAGVMRDISSEKMFAGGAKKIGIMLIVATANLIDNVLVLGGVLRSITISYFIAGEGISMIENWSQMGLPVPKRLRNVLRELRGDEENKGEGKCESTENCQERP